MHILPYGMFIPLKPYAFPYYIIYRVFSSNSALTPFKSVYHNTPNMSIKILQICLPRLIVKDRPDADMDTVKPVYVDEAAKLAAEIDRFSSDFDLHEYKDTVENWELQVQNIADDIRKGNATEYKNYLGTVIEESDNIEDVRKAAELFVKLAEYKPLAKVEELEEVNLNQIDNVLSNTVPKSEEK